VSSCAKAREQGSAHDSAPNIVVGNYTSELRERELVWKADRDAVRPGIEVPASLGRKHPRTGQIVGVVDDNYFCRRVDFERLAPDPTR
jgi:hypothetical protein